MISFTWTGHLEPAVRTTQKKKYVDPAYQKYAACKEAIAWAFKQAVYDNPGYAVDYPLFPTQWLEVSLYIMRPKRGTGDVDNLAKSVLDALNKLAWTDDRQVIGISARIINLPKERLVTVIREVDWDHNRSVDEADFDSVYTDVQRMEAEDLADQAPRV